MRKQSATDVIREAIRQSGASSNQLGNHAGVDPSQVSRFLAGERSLTLDTVDRLLAAIGCGVALVGEPSADKLTLLKRKRRRRRKDD